MLSRIHAAGNSALNGAIQYCIDENEFERIVQIIVDSLEINLTNDKDFNQLRVDFMFFLIRIQSPSKHPV